TSVCNGIKDNLPCSDSACAGGQGFCSSAGACSCDAPPDMTELPDLAEPAVAEQPDMAKKAPSKNGGGGCEVASGRRDADAGLVLLMGMWLVFAVRRRYSGVIFRLSK